MNKLSLDERQIDDTIILFEDKRDCCGCTACCSICPKNAIKMKPDKEGFFYPEIDTKRCVRCKLCIKICPM